MPARSAAPRRGRSNGTRLRARRGAGAGAGTGTAAACVVPAARSSASRSAPTSSVADAKRCSGSLASPRASTSSSSGGRDGFVGRGGRDRRAHVRHRLGRRRLALERAPSRQELEGDDRECVEVARGAGALTAGLLRCQVAGGADHGAHLGEGAEVGGARDAEVGDLDALVVVEQEVRRLDVAMHDPVRVRSVERRRGLPEPVERAADRLGAVALEAVGERSAREILHHDVGAAIVLADVEDRDRVGRVREPGDGEPLAREAASDRVVVRESAREQLDRDDAREVGVLRPVDLAHAAACDQLRVPVALGKPTLVHHDGVPRPQPPKTRRDSSWRVEGSVKNA